MNLLDLLELARKVGPKASELLDDVKKQNWPEAVRDAGETLILLGDWLESNKLLESEPAMLMQMGNDCCPENCKGAEDKATGLGRFRIGERLLVRIAKRRTKNTLMQEGFKLIDPAKSTPLGHTEVEGLFDAAELDDDTIINEAVKLGLLDEEKLRGPIQNLIDWIINNKEKILELIKFIMSILILFI
jgi:hypothetical protein